MESEAKPQSYILHWSIMLWLHFPTECACGQKNAGWAPKPGLHVMAERKILPPKRIDPWLSWKLTNDTELSHSILQPKIDEYVAVCTRETWSDGQGRKVVETTSG